MKNTILSLMVPMFLTLFAYQTNALATHNPSLSGFKDVKQCEEELAVWDKKIHTLKENALNTVNDNSSKKMVKLASDLESETRAIGEELRDLKLGRLNENKSRKAQEEIQNRFANMQKKYDQLQAE